MRFHVDGEAGVPVGGGGGVEVGDGGEAGPALRGSSQISTRAED